MQGFSAGDGTSQGVGSRGFWRNEEVRISLADLVRSTELNDQEFVCERGRFPSLDSVMPDKSVPAILLSLVKM